MKSFCGCVALGCWMLVLASPAWAAAGSGFGLYGGFASHTSKGQFTVPPLTGVEFEFTSSGISFGIDYQFAIGDSFSISPFLMTSSEQFEEKTNVFTEAEDGSHSILGVQFRYWLDLLFVGVHIGQYTEVINFSTGDAGFVGTGGGVVVGWENDDGLFFSGQYDSATLKDDDDVAETDLTGFRLHIGFRWK